jgi:hypothetical protein
MRLKLRAEMITGFLFTPAPVSLSRSTCPSWQCLGKSVRWLNKQRTTQGRLLVDYKNVLGFGELHYETGKT